MKEMTGDLFEIDCDALVITTNGTVKKDGSAVMGRGVALQAKEKHPGLDGYLGLAIRIGGNHTRLLGHDHVTSRALVSLPVKHSWFDPADAELIERSLVELVALTNKSGWETVVLPRPGCGNGKLCWERCPGLCEAPVKPIVTRLLDDRFIVVERD